jgi:hypothetical protein
MNDQLLAEYIRTFCGYGDYSGAWWLVGMEEGGGNTTEEIDTRLHRSESATSTSRVRSGVLPACPPAGASGEGDAPSRRR